MLDLTALAQDPYKNKPVTSLSDALARSRSANQGSRSSGGRFTSASLPALEGDDFHPDSVYWIRQAKASLGHMGRLLEAGYQDWADQTWPGETIQALTWRTIRDMAEASIAAHERGERDIHTMAEAAHQRLAQLIKENA